MFINIHRKVLLHGPTVGMGESGAGNRAVKGITSKQRLLNSLAILYVVPIPCRSYRLLTPLVGIWKLEQRLRWSLAPAVGVTLESREAYARALCCTATAGGLTAAPAVPREQSCTCRCVNRTSGIPLYFPNLQWSQRHVRGSFSGCQN